MGMIYEIGSVEHNIPRDFKKAMQFYLKTISKTKVGLDAVCIGSVYLEGRNGFEKNEKKAANMDDPSGQFYLEFIYLYGLYVKVDLGCALELFKKSLKGGYKFAQFEIDMVELVKSTASMQITLPKDDYKQLNKIIGTTNSEQYNEDMDDVD